MLAATCASSMPAARPEPPKKIGVAMPPGAMLFTVTPKGASSIPATLVRWRTAALAAL